MICILNETSENFLSFEITCGNPKWKELSHYTVRTSDSKCGISFTLLQLNVNFNGLWLFNEDPVCHMVDGSSPGLSRL